MKTMLIGASMLAATLALPASAFAATYYYVNTDGHMQSVSADDSSSAMSMTQNMAAGSQVTLDSDTLGRDIYQYVSTLGTLKVVVAANATAALTTASDIAAHSGVINVDVAGNPITTDMTVTNSNSGTGMSPNSSNTVMSTSNANDMTGSTQGTTGVTNNGTQTSQSGTQSTTM